MRRASGELFWCHVSGRALDMADPHAAGIWTFLGAYDVAVRFVVAAIAFGLIFQAVHLRHYGFAVLFGALALLFNPLVPTFAFAGDWSRALVVACAIPFVVSLAWNGVPLLRRR